MADDPLVDAETMARLSAMMRRAPYEQPGAFAGAVPAVPTDAEVNPYNREFPGYIGEPPMPAVYNDRFSDLVERPPQGMTFGPSSEGFPQGGSGTTFPREEFGSLPLDRTMREGASPPPIQRGSFPAEAGPAFLGGSAGPGGSPFAADRAARIEQLMQQLEEDRMLEERLRALGR